MLCLCITIVTIILLIIAILFFPMIKIKHLKLGTHWVIVLLAAIILIASKQVSLSSIWSSFTSNTSMNPLKILVLFISMTVLSIFLDEIGFFKYLATKTTKLFKNSQVKLFFGFYALISLLTIFTSNDIIILTFTPFLCYYAKNTKISPIPYLVSEFIAANTWSMTLIIGNPTNIYLASAFQIDFLSYLKTMILPTLAAGIISLLLLFIIFRKKLKEPMTVYEEKIEKPNKVLLIIGLAHLIITTILLAISSYIHLEMWYIALSLAISVLLMATLYLMIRKRKLIPVRMTLMRAPWNLIPFVLSMFIIVLSLKEQGITQKIAEMLNKSNSLYTYGFFGALIANLINNIPMSVLFGDVLAGADMMNVYASIIASNIAAFITPIGALAGIMWMSLLKTYEVNYSFKQFTLYGLIIGIPSLAAALSILLLL
ncbi:MAG: hypothetical protein K2G50_01360 [Anaeroplasmataceae bacterium]|nr:hypothetical protein [Anaeroplasmataceae bacterium]